MSLPLSTYSGSHGLREGRIRTCFQKRRNLKQVHWVVVGGWALSGTRLGKGGAFTASKSNLGFEFNLLFLVE